MVLFRSFEGGGVTSRLELEPFFEGRVFGQVWSRIGKHHQDTEAVKYNLFNSTKSGRFSWV